MEDFEPEAIAARVPPLARLLAERAQASMEEQAAENEDRIAAAQTRVADLDRRLSAQMNDILHAESFRRLEATWRG